jgi:hypothetical protein
MTQRINPTTNEYKAMLDALGVVVETPYNWAEYNQKSMHVSFLRHISEDRGGLYTQYFSVWLKENKEVVE